MGQIGGVNRHESCEALLPPCEKEKHEFQDEEEAARRGTASVR